MTLLRDCQHSSKEEFTVCKSCERFGNRGLPARLSWKPRLTQQDSEPLREEIQVNEEFCESWELSATKLPARESSTKALHEGSAHPGC